MVTTKKLETLNTNEHTKDPSQMFENINVLMTNKVLRLSGLAAMAAGTLYIGIQAIHPYDVLESVTTTRWSVTHYLSIGMDIFALLGLVGLYSKQANKAGKLGLAGYLLFSLFWALSLAFHFIEAFISPSLVHVAPKFVSGLLGLVTSTPSEVSLGLLPAVYALAGILGYAIGGLLFGMVTMRARVLPRRAGALLTFGIVLPILTSSFVHHPYDRILAVPVGLALIWLGHSIWTNRKV